MPTPIDECESSFIDLATIVLPSHFAQLKENMASAFPASRIREHGVGQVTLLQQLHREKDFSGCYVFVENKEPLYVGISR